MQRKTLILRLSSLGDIVHATAAFAPLRAAGAEIHILVKPAFRDLIESCAPGVKVKVYDPRARGESAARAELLRWIESEGFACILDLHDTLRTRLWRARLRKLAPVFVARKPRLREFLVYFLRLRAAAGLGRGGRARRMRATAIEAVRTLWGVEFSQDAAPWTELSAPQATTIIPGVPEREYIVMVPGSAWPGKRWPEARFQEVATYVARAFPVVVLGGPNEDYCERIAASARTLAPDSVSLHGKTTIGECARVLAGALVVIGNDTGLVHIAEALGKDVIAIEGPTHPAQGYSVYRPGSRLVAADLACRPCSKNGRICWRFGTRACMEKIAASAVLKQLEGRLAGPGLGPGPGREARARDSAL